jgi:2-polyprenyl-3-methyl-5-hydroxy-6-metoxy-1,4-benzoquinol methylase
MVNLPHTVHGYRDRVDAMLDNLHQAKRTSQKLIAYTSENRYQRHNTSATHHGEFNPLGTLVGTRRSSNAASELVSSNSPQVRTARDLSRLNFNNPLGGLGDNVVNVVDAAVEAARDAAIAAQNVISPSEIPSSLEDLPPYVHVYKHNLEQGDDIWMAQNWRLTKEQRSRFDVIAQMIDFNNKSVLDVGCGVGDFAEYLRLRGVAPARYRGIDVLPEFVAEAKNRHISDWAEFAVGDALADPGSLGDESEWDYVVMSGTLSTHPPEQAKQMLTNSWNVVREGMIFNFLTKEFNWGSYPMKVRVWQSISRAGPGLRVRPDSTRGKESLFWGWTWRPKVLLEWCKRRSGVMSVRLISGYIEGDATIVMRRPWRS